MWLGRDSDRGPGAGARPAVAGGPRHRPVQHPVLAGEPRSIGGRAGHDRAVPDHRARADGRREPRPAGARHRHGRSGVRAHDGLDEARRQPRPAGPRPRAFRVRNAGRVPGDPALRRGPHHPAPGAAHPRPEWRLASAAAGEPPRARDPPRGPQGTRHGRAGLRVGAALGVPGRGLGRVRRLDRARRPVRRLGGAGDRLGETARDRPALRRAMR